MSWILKGEESLCVRIQKKQTFMAGRMLEGFTLELVVATSVFADGVESKVTKVVRVYTDTSIQ
jgi:hypothetical protein